MADRILNRLREFCLALPEATQGLGMAPSFVVGKKPFVWYLDNHHGDGRLAIWLKGSPGTQDAFVAADPVHYFVPPYVGPKGWLGIWLDVKEVDWDEVKELLREAYQAQAPKRLASMLAKE